ncbi:hypothetical protein [Leisingera methylohalidivorans]|uniref:Uncharacterized protein n=1 Tax=Leisingera methylohalidivorans DSM 14336 TaxID=999552 RepID=V9W1W4_9RHOB|nr:hypothetical protein [Leisingera methylohalidivorans]AHD03167.1 hypothetical protein METH_15280 [Leisingera methylohalidivorans DSM 14336]
MILLAMVFYVVVGCALVAVPTALVQGARYGKDETGRPRAVRNTGLAVVGLPFVLTALGVYLITAETAQNSPDLWVGLFLWLMAFAFSMVVLVPLGLISFWFGKLIGSSKV